VLHCNGVCIFSRFRDWALIVTQNMFTNTLTNTATNERTDKQTRLIAISPDGGNNRPTNLHVVMYAAVSNSPTCDITNVWQRSWDSIALYWNLHLITGDDTRRGQGHRHQHKEATAPSDTLWWHLDSDSDRIYDSYAGTFTHVLSSQYNVACSHWNPRQHCTHYSLQ